MIYWGIDPGPEMCGIAGIRNGKPFGFEVPTSQLTNSYVPYPVNEFDGEFYAPAKVRVGLEMPECMGKEIGRDVLETAVVVGQIMACLDPICRIIRYNRSAIKRYFGVTNKKDNGAKPPGHDSQVRTAMIARWGEPGTAKKPGPTYGITGDAWAALAVATCVYDKERHEKQKEEVGGNL